MKIPPVPRAIALTFDKNKPEDRKLWRKFILVKEKMPVRSHSGALRVLIEAQHQKDVESGASPDIR